MIRTAVLVALAAGLVAMTAPTSASAQVGCLPPEEPYPFEPPADDPELRALIDEQYQAYILGTETYLNCLNDEAIHVRTKFRTILNRYLQFFGDEAGIQIEVPG